MISLCTILWTLIFVPFYFVGLKLHKIKERSDVITISKKIVNNSLLVEGDDKPLAFFFGKTFGGYVHQIQTQRGDTVNEIYLLATDKKYSELIKSDIIKDNDNGKKIITYYRTGNFFCIGYKKRDVSLNNIVPTNKQQDIITDIIQNYNTSTNNIITAYIYGKPGTGKSTIPMILAQELTGSLCKTFNPTDPGDTLDNLYSQVSPSSKSPLILVIEEIDGIIYKIHNGIEDHKHIPILVKNKSGWNTFFDDLKYLYPNMIFILTSNVNPDAIDCKDSCYLRPGRVDYRYELNV